MTVLIDGPAEVTGNDVLLMGASSDPINQALMRWKDETPDLHEFMPDHHRLVLEHWIWEHREQLAGKQILDVGAQNPRRWLGDGYRTFGHTADVEADIKGDLLNLSLREWGQWDAIICTEVLEHCEDPFRAMAEMGVALKDGGLLLVTSPFLWPWHGTEDYADYWRFTRQGWQLLLKDFKDVEIKAVPWTVEGATMLDFVRRFEGWGFRNFIEGHTGYLCEAHKAG
jgi:SAM-dependent methyltransferase